MLSSPRARSRRSRAICPAPTALDEVKLFTRCAFSFSFSILVVLEVGMESGAAARKLVRWMEIWSASRIVCESGRRE